VGRRVPAAAGEDMHAKAGWPAWQAQWARGARPPCAAPACITPLQPMPPPLLCGTHALCSPHMLLCTPPPPPHTHTLNSQLLQLDAISRDRSVSGTNPGVTELQTMVAGTCLASCRGGGGGGGGGRQGSWLRHPGIKLGRQKQGQGHTLGQPLTIKASSQGRQRGP